MEDAATRDHETQRLGDVLLRSIGFDTAALWKDVQVCVARAGHRSPTRTLFVSVLRAASPSSAPVSPSRWAARSSSSGTDPPRLCFATSLVLIARARSQPRSTCQSKASRAHRRVVTAVSTPCMQCFFARRCRPCRLLRRVGFVLGRFIKVLDCENRICEFNQEACRLNAYNGNKSLIRSFP